MDEYLKMILALPEEFFEGWEWKEGDIFHHKEIGSDFWNENYEECLDGEMRPLPSQKQLQSMTGLTPIEFIEDFYEFSQEPPTQNENLEIYKIDMECFVLAYVMNRKYKKFWNGEDWVE